MSAQAASGVGETDSLKGRLQAAAPPKAAVTGFDNSLVMKCLATVNMGGSAEKGEERKVSLLHPLVQSLGRTPMVVACWLMDIQSLSLSLLGCHVYI